MSTNDYGLDYTAKNGRKADAELNEMLNDPATMFDTARLLRILLNIAHRGKNAIDENIHLFSTNPPLHLLLVGQCAAFYAYGPRDRITTVYLLGFCKRSIYLQRVDAAVASLIDV